MDNLLIFQCILVQLPVTPVADPPDVIANKVKRCKTDALEGLEMGNAERPECDNLLTIYQLCTGSSQEQVCLVLLLRKEPCP